MRAVAEEVLAGQLPDPPQAGGAAAGAADAAADAAG